MKTRIIAVMWFFMFSNYLDRLAMSFVAPNIMKSLSINPGSFGVVLSSFGLGYFLGQIPGGLMADRWGAKRLLVIGPILWALFTGVTGLMASLAGFAIVRACLGVAEGISSGPFWKMLGDNFSPEQRSRAVAVCITSTAVAPAVASVVVGKLVGAYGWHIVFFVMVVPALLAALVNYSLIPTVMTSPLTSPARNTSHISPLGFAIRLPSFWLLATAYFALNLTFWGYVGWMPSYLALQRHLDIKALGPLSGIPYAFAFLGMLFCGWLDSRLLNRFRSPLLAAAFIVIGLSLLLAYRAVTIPLAELGLCGAAFFLYGVMGPLSAIVLDLSPKPYVGTYSGTVFTASQLGGVVAPSVIGFLVNATGRFASGFGFMIVSLCVSAVCILMLPRASRASTPVVSPDFHEVVESTRSHV